MMLSIFLLQHIAKFLNSKDGSIFHKGQWMQGKPVHNAKKAEPHQRRLKTA